MTQPETHHASTDAARYRISVAGRLDASWTANFDNMDARYDRLPSGQTVTVLTGLVADQAQLHGMLSRIRDLGIPLVCVCRLEEVQA